MTRRGAIGMLAASAAFSALSGCDFLFSSDSLRYRMTVEVETPAGLRRGSSVIESRSHDGPRWGDAPGLRYSVQGEAVAVDLPGGRTLFALLVPPGSSDAAHYQAQLFVEALRHGAKPSAPIDADLSQGGVWREVRRQAWRKSIALALPPRDYPLLVTFADVHDPKSVVRVDPADLEATFGPGVRLKAIIVAATDEPITTRIEERLSNEFWRRKARVHQGELASSGGSMRNPYLKSLAGTLSKDDFTSEIAQ